MVRLRGVGGVYSKVVYTVLLVQFHARIILYWCRAISKARCPTAFGRKALVRSSEQLLALRQTHPPPSSSAPCILLFGSSPLLSLQSYLSVSELECCLRYLRLALRQSAAVALPVRAWCSSPGYSPPPSLPPSPPGQRQFRPKRCGSSEARSTDPSICGHSILCTRIFCIPGLRPPAPLIPVPPWLLA